MTILVVNCGSSSLRMEVIALPSESRSARLAAAGVGGRATLTIEQPGRQPSQEELALADHRAAVAVALDRLQAAGGLDRLDAVGHRVVHGGDEFTEPALVDGDVLAALDRLEALAPLHNGPGLTAIRACRERLGPALPMVAVFDTAFHASLPPRARGYALPEALARRHGIRRYGFHGTSCRAVLARYAARTGLPAARVTAVILHLGSGCSATAVRDGMSIDTSMGFTPLEGLMMGTRAGDLDPAVVGHLARGEHVAVAEVEDWLNTRSGLLGVSGSSADMQALLPRAATDARAGLAVEMFCYRARKYVGAYLAALGGAPAVIFTGAIGEHAPAVRARIADGLDWCGLHLDPERNAAARGAEARISADGARVAAWVVPTDEAGVIARDTAECLRRSVAPRSAP